MKSLTIRGMALAVSIFVGSSVPILAQILVNPAPDQNDNVVGPQLIAWSALQEPQPISQQPQPVLQANDTSSQVQSQSPVPPDAQPPASQSVSGVIAKAGNNYVLQTTDSLTYKLEDQKTASQYEGKRVRVFGMLDRATGMIRVRSIELLS